MNIELTDQERRLLLIALRQNDGTTLCPDWASVDQRQISLLLDRVRAALLEGLEGVPA